MATPPQGRKMAPERPFPILIETGKSYPKTGLLPAVLPAVSPAVSRRLDSGFPAARQRFPGGSTAVSQRFDRGFPAVRQGFPSGSTGVSQRFDRGFPAFRQGFPSGSTAVSRRLDSGFPAVRQGFPSGFPANRHGGEDRVPRQHRRRREDGAPGPHRHGGEDGVRRREDGGQDPVPGGEPGQQLPGSQPAHGEVRRRAARHQRASSPELRPPEEPGGVRPEGKAGDAGGGDGSLQRSQLREFPRLPLYRDFHRWAEMGQRLLDLHIGFESAEPYLLERHEREGVDPKRAILRADKSSGTITLDARTTLASCRRRHGSTSWGTAPPWSGCWTSTRRGKPRTRPSGRSSTTTAFPTTRSGSSTAAAVCTVSVATMEIVDSMAHRELGERRGQAPGHGV